jgi:hypothetical protein
MIAAQNKDPELADAVAVVAVERLVLTQGINRVLPTASTIVVCAAARTDRKEANAMLARRLENLAFVMPAALLSDTLDVLRILRSLDEELGCLLGRAIATARLGFPQITRA